MKPDDEHRRDDELNYDYEKNYHYKQRKKRIDTQTINTYRWIDDETSESNPHRESLIALMTRSNQKPFNNLPALITYK